jgi:hypothetical protein
VNKGNVTFTPAAGLAVGRTVEVDRTVVDTFNQGSTSFLRLTGDGPAGSRPDRHQ